MNAFNRRDFLRTAGGLTGAGVLGSLGIVRDARAAGTGTTLVTIHLTGGNDTLNTVIPHADPLYYSVRGGLAVPRSEIIRLTDRIGWHPALAPLKASYDQGRVAVVTGVGYPRFDYSHFQAMQIYWTGNPQRTPTTGWLGRTLDGVLAGGGTIDPLLAVNVGWDSQPSLQGANFIAPLLPPNPDWYWIPSRDERQFTALSKILSQPPLRRSTTYDQLVRNSRAGLDAYTMVKQAGALDAGVPYPEDYFSQGLSFVGKLLRADPAIRVVALTQGSYDTHENQYGHHAQQLGELANGLKAFLADLERNGTADRVIVLLWSEFARRVLPNGDAGTDHGSAQAMMLLGKGVKGGVHGAPPSLAPADLVDDGNLPMTVDFRSLYATLLDGWLGVDAASVLGASWPSLPILL